MTTSEACTTGSLRLNGPGVPIRHLRHLHSGGELHAKVGQQVTPDSLIGHVGSDELLHFMRIETDQDRLLAKLLKAEGQDVKRGEPVAYYMYMFGLGYREYVSPVNGTVASINVRNGMIGIREHPEPLLAGMYGEVARIIDGYGAEIATTGTAIEAAAGWGGTAWGQLELMVDSPDGRADVSAIGPQSLGKVLVAGSHADAKLLAAAYRHGARAIIAGGVDQLSADQFTEFAANMTYEEYQTRYYTNQTSDQGHRGGLDRVLMPVLALDGLGPVPIRPQAWRLLSELAGEHAFVDAAHQAAWTGPRPLLIIGGNGSPRALSPSDGSSIVRVIGGRYGGRTGRILEEDMPTVLETGYRTSGARVALHHLAGGTPGTSGNGEEIVVPWANLERINVTG